MPKYKLRMGFWVWPQLFNTEQEALAEAKFQFQHLFSAHRYYLSEPYRYQTWGGVKVVRYKAVDRQAESIIPGWARVQFDIDELQEENQPGSCTPSAIELSKQG